LLFAVFVALFVVSRSARADEPSQKLEWKSEWSTFRPAEYVATGVLGTAALYTTFVMKPASSPHWTGGILFDDSARDALRLRSPGARDTIRTASDITAVTTVVLAVGVDSIVVPLARRSDAVALQLTLMDAESFAMSMLVTSSLYNTVGRARPSYEDCQRDPSFDPLCSTGATASFPSGHTTAAFTAAGLSCAHHLNLSLYGSPLADGLACGGEIALAAATATFRVMGDRHYVTDVLAGSVIGFGFGFGAPMLLHYGTHGHADRSVTIAPMGGTSTAGLIATGTF
jgi:membrane-associated phospholipid phosphatase